MHSPLSIRFWGTRGSFPVGTSRAALREHMVEAVHLAEGKPLKSRAEAEAFIDTIFPGTIPRFFGNNTSCVEILDDDADTHIFCDAGSGLCDAGQYWVDHGASSGATYHLFITHLHWDHIQGFPFFPQIYIPGNRIIVHGFHENLEHAFRLQMSAPFFPVPFDALKASIAFEVHTPGVPFEVAGYTVHSIEQKHPGLSYGYRFEKAGKSIVYSTDSEHLEGVEEAGYPFVEFFKGTDVLIFDGMYSADDDARKLEWGHSSSMMGVELAHRAQAKHLVLFHHDPTRTDEELEQSLSHAQNYAADCDYDYPQDISASYDGWELNL